jgi:hypothetical protein
MIAPHSRNLFDAATLDIWARRATDDAFVQRQRVLADLCLGLRNTDTGEQAWLVVLEDGVQAGTGTRATDFTLEGGQQAFDDLCCGFPFNRLVRQHRLTVAGNLRSCVQNWLLVYGLIRLIVSLEI